MHLRLHPQSAPAHSGASLASLSGHARCSLGRALQHSGSLKTHPDSQTARTRRTTPAGAPPGHTPAGARCPMDDAVPSPFAAANCVWRTALAPRLAVVPQVCILYCAGAGAGGQQRREWDCCSLSSAISGSFHRTAHPIPASRNHTNPCLRLRLIALLRLARPCR